MLLFQTFKGSPEERGSPLTIPVKSNFVPLKELNIKIKITDEDGEEKKTKSVDVDIKGCTLGELCYCISYLRMGTVSILIHITYS